jgi:16S rRNA processing protein RimM
MVQMKGDTDYRVLARITRPRGNKGEVAADNLAGGLGFFKTGKAYSVVLANLQDQALVIDHVWEHNGRLILKFAGVETISAAEKLRSAVIRIAKDELEPLQAGEYFLDDLIGCRLEDESTGKEVGVVCEVHEPPAGALLFEVVDSQQKKMLVPFVNEICLEIDCKAQRILVRLPDGLEELKI